MTSLTAERLLSAFRSSGNKQEAKRLLSTFPDQSKIKNITDSYYSSRPYLIHQAAYNGWTDVVELLVTTYHCSPNCTTYWGNTSLHWACNTNELPTVKLLTAQYCLNPLQANNSGVTPLYWSSGETRKYLQQIIGKSVCLYVNCLYICTFKIDYSIVHSWCNTVPFV